MGAAAGLIGPGILMGQANRPAETAAADVSAENQIAESEVEQQLRLLFERDGRPMPNMRLTAPADPSAAAQPVAAQPAAPQPPANRSQANVAAPMQPRYSTAPTPAPAPSGNRFTSFFKRLMPGGNRSAAAPPRQLPTMPQQPGIPQPQPMPARAAIGAPVIPPPDSRVSQPSAQSPLGAAAAQPAAGSASSSAEEVISLGAPESTDELMDEDMLVEPDDSEESELIFEPPIERETSPIESLPPQLESRTAPLDEVIETESQSPEIAEPYTGKSLDEPSAPAALPIPANVRPLTDAANENAAETNEDAEEAAEGAEDSAEAAAAAKMRRILQRTDVKGLKGFCPVTLRDQRELADARSEFVSSYRGQKFHFATPEAQEKFEANPTRYAPVAYGADVVELVKDEEIVEGSLDFAAWYKGRLYLFGSQATHAAFVEAPEKFATPKWLE
jgi:YHS domain-containing protein